MVNMKYIKKLINIIIFILLVTLAIFILSIYFILFLFSNIFLHIINKTPIDTHIDNIKNGRRL
jgi:hypothetical protein